ncbi:MAG TPA: asparagine synthase (glutamine-hydrolyzing) [Azospirillum sp.]|nr:asparagine synthase (glutamine-hydrolyzing) [Azospirillum sp.]
MCGIAGAAGHGGGALVARMIGALRHRGPDGEGYFEDGRMALGQCRLAIVDPANGRQPIANEDGTLQLVCNGEIYNSPELRRDLLARGHRFRTGTDVEVILHLYEEMGGDCVRRLRGMFAFALWDSRQGTLLLARDHLGQKPLYYALDGDRLLFASEVKAILAARSASPRIDLDGLWHYISLRFLPDEHTLFGGIRKLPAATRLTWRDGRMETERYWQLDFTRKRGGGEREAIDALDAKLQETVRAHLLSDVPVGAFVSGGIDSSLVAAIMARHAAGPVPSFSIGVEEQGFDELPYARMAAQACGLEAHERRVHADLVHLVPAMVHALDEPSDPFGVGVYLASREAARRVKVVLGGDGGDENFAGYDRFAGQRLAGWYALLPGWLRGGVMGPAIGLLPETFAYKSLAQKARWLQRMAGFTAGERYAESMSFHRFDRDRQRRLFTPEAQRAVADPDSLARILVHFDSGHAAHPVDRMLYTDLMTRIPDHLLMIVDRMSMAHSLECRSPLLDVELVEHAAGLPAHLKLRGLRLKHALREVAARYLPAELVNRPKQGFGFPLGAWMRGELRGLLEGAFAQSRFVELGLFERAALRTLLDEHLSGAQDHSYRLWIVLNLEIWHRLFLEGRSVDAVCDDVASLMAKAA